MLYVTLQPSLVSSVFDFDHGRFQVRTTMGGGEGRAPDCNQCEEENPKREKRHGHDFVSPLKERKALNRRDPKERDESACAVKEELGFEVLHPYMWHWSEGARSAAINVVMFSLKLISVGGHCSQPPIQSLERTASVAHELRN